VCISDVNMTKFFRPMAKTAAYKTKTKITRLEVNKLKALGGFNF